MKKIRKAHGGKKIKDILNKSVITWHMNWFNTLILQLVMY